MIKMKIIHILKKVGLMAAFSVFSISLVSCDGGSGSSSLANTGGTDTGDTDTGDTSTGGSLAKGFTRIMLSGDAEGTQPVDTDDEIQIFVDGKRVQQTVWRGDFPSLGPGIPAVDVPVGSTAEFRFQPPANRQGSVGAVYINAYYEAQGQAMAQLGV